MTFLRTSLLLAALLLGCFPAALRAEAPTPDATFRGQVIQGTRADTARSAGRWESWFNASSSYAIAANATGIWFAAGGKLWRYNPATQTVDVATSSITHPDINNFMFTAQVAPDGRLALSCRAAILLWDTRAWTRLPQPNGNANAHFVAFDADRALWANSGSAAYRWDKTQWTVGKTIPQNSGTWPLNGGWFMWNNFGQGNSWKPHTWFSRDFSQHTEYPATTAGKDYRFVGRAYHTPQGFIGEFYDQWDGPHTLSTITTSTFTPLLTAKYLVLDLATGEVFRAVEKDAGLAIETAAGAAVATLPPMPPLKNDYANSEVLFRDKNGHYFRRFWRCDGKVWKPMLPAHGFLFDGSMREAVESGRLAFDPATATWRDRFPELPVNVRNFDPATRIGWLTTVNYKPESSTTEKIRFAPDGARTVLLKLPSGDDMPAIATFVTDHSTGVWLAGSREGVFCWDGKVYRGYDTGPSNVRSSEIGSPKMVTAPAGALWLYKSSRNFFRFDPKTLDFAPAEPFDDFRFTIAGKTLSIVGTPIDGSWDWNSHLGRVYSRDADGWTPLANPFNSNPTVSRGSTFGDTQFYAYPVRGVRGDRILLSCFLGVFEWDLKANRWAFLTPRSNNWACYDEQGARVLVSNDWIGEILRFTGDPFEPGAGAPLQAGLEADIARILKDLDDEVYRTRARATEEAVNLLRKNPREVAAILNRPAAAEHYSTEVKARVALILESLPDAVSPSDQERSLAVFAATGNSLLERMHPPLPADLKLLIEPGMNIEHAAAVFFAAGAHYSNDIHNTHYPDPSYRGFLLADRTMVYLRIADKEDARTITSIGLGPAGKGNDPKWDWSATTKNSLPRLELQPNRARYPD